MNQDYVPTLVAHRLLAALDRRVWELAEDAADELADLCRGDHNACSAYIARALPQPRPERAMKKAEREARLACDRYEATGPPALPPWT